MHIGEGGGVRWGFKYLGVGYRAIRNFVTLEVSRAVLGGGDP